MVRPIRSQRKLTLSSRRDAAAIVELAVVLPVLFILLFGSIELCQRLFVKQSLVVSSYESARLATRKTSTASDVVDRCQTLLTQRGVKGGQVTVQPADLLATSSGAEIQVTVTIPWSQNVISRYVLTDQGALTVQATMLRE